MSPLRGRRGWERKVDEQVEREAAERDAQRATERISRAATGGGPLATAGPPGPPRPIATAPAAGCPTSPGSRRSWPAPGAFEDLVARIGAPGEPPPATGKGRHAGLTAVPHGAKSFLAAALALAAGERILWVARDAEIGDRVAEELAAWVGDIDAVAVLEPRTALAYERSELVADETAARVAALSAWRSGRARILVASVQALLQHTIAPADLPDEPRRLAPGARVDASRRSSASSSPSATSPVLEVAGKGEFARRGGIVDVFPPSGALPVRIEFFGDEIESLRTFDPTDQRSTGTVDRDRAPAGLASSSCPHEGAEALARSPRDGAVEAPRAPRGRLRAADRRRRRGPARALRRATRAPPRSATRPRSGRRSSPRAPPSTTSMPARSSSSTSRATSARPPSSCGARPTSGAPSSSRPATCRRPGRRRSWAGGPGSRGSSRARTLELTWESEAAKDAAIAGGGLSSGDAFGWREPTLPPGRAQQLGDAVERWRAGGSGAVAGVVADADATPPRIVLASDQAPRLAELLDEAGHPAGVTANVTDAPPPGAIVLVERSLNGGFAGGPDGLVFVTDRELFGNVRVRRPKAMRRVVPRDILERLTPGDLVVHIDHGVARYERMLRRSAGEGDERDYLELSFAAGDRIYVPVEQIARVTPLLRRRAAAAVASSAARSGSGRSSASGGPSRTSPRSSSRSTRPGPTRPGYPFAADTPWQAEMEASFPYEETVDQLRAVARGEGRHGGRPADGPARRRRRRLRQDRGRAAGRVQGDPGRQAGRGPRPDDRPRRPAPRDVPGQRFAAFPVKVGLLSRFVPPKEQARTLDGLADGSVDIVIGTHRLLSKDVRFRDLGLLVVDEEQRFGVAAKERLKQLRREVDVLTLSATPIPRTLNLALAGVRDMSVIETPPEDRLPIQTRVAEASAGLVRDAILRELDRGGQVFFVHNRVETIEAQAEQLRRMLPDVRIVVGHGQMPEGAPRERDARRSPAATADVLVCTTIIESGLDIPNANTIIIDRADTLGLAQLYQLRGRVGRSSRRAYAYLLYRRRERMSEEARKRLQAIFNASELGAGFQIALVRPRDPGRRQHPRRRAVGPHGRRRLRPLLAAARRGRRGAQGASARAARRSSRCRRPSSTCRSRPTCPTTTSPTRPRSSSSTGAWRGPASAGRPRRLPPGGHRPLRADAARRSSASSRSPSCGSPPRARASSSISREEGQLVVRFGAGLSRATAMRLLGPGALPGVRPSEVTFASNQVRIRLPRDPRRSWGLTQAVVARLSTELATIE